MPYGLNPGLFFRRQQLPNEDHLAIESPFKKFMMQKATEPEMSEPAQPPQNPLMTAYQSLINGDNRPANTAYGNFLAKGEPKQEDFSPSKKRRLAAMLAGGLAGYAGNNQAAANANKINVAPYERALSNYSREGERLKEAATLEETGYKNKVAAVKGALDAENDARARATADRVADNLIQSRNMNMKEAEQRMKNAGLHYEMDQNTGILNIIRADGSVQPVGKYKLSTGESIANEKEMAQFKEQLDRTSTAMSQNRQYGMEQGMEKVRQNNRKEIDSDNFDRSIMRDAFQSGLPTPSSNTPLNVQREKLAAVKARVDLQPTRYKNVWDKENQQLVGDPATPEYQELYVLLHGYPTSVNGVQPVQSVGSGRFIKE